MPLHPLLQISRYCTKRQMCWLGLWPIAALLLCASGAWWLARSEASARAEVDAVARREASTLASAYALQLSHTVDQIDQNLSNLKYFLENAPQAVRLMDQARKGMYPPEKNVYVNVFDEKGRLRDSTVAVPGSTNIARDDLFEQLGANPNAGLSITKHESAPGVARPTVWFSRRLEKPDGAFAGIISVAVESRFLGSFYDHTALGRGDFVTVRSTTG